MTAPAKRTTIRVETQGQATLPANLLAQLGLKPGDLLSVTETADGLLLTNETLAADRDFELVDAEFRKQGLSLEEMIESGREIRGELLKEMYDLDG